MTTPDRTVEEIIREAHIFLPVDLEGREEFLVDLEQTLQAERKKREEAYKQGEERAIRSKDVQNKIKEAVEAERERILKIVIDSLKVLETEQWSNKEFPDDKGLVSIGINRAYKHVEYIKNLQALTQPNNSK